MMRKLFLTGLVLCGLCLIAGASPQDDFLKAWKFFKANNYAEGIPLLKKAAEQGHPGAQEDLAYIYIYGRSVKKDVPEGVKWLKESAKHGSTKSMYNLGVIYYSGNGVAKNQAEALEWFRKAAKAGDPRAKSMLKKLEALR
ncbi:MAG: tetratricopeptide repeat protein [Victivallaceae bacterium]|nr:tetratricopeptide repeat protein [Victivallaceae bacterium]